MDRMRQETEKGRLSENRISWLRKRPGVIVQLAGEANQRAGEDKQRAGEDKQRAEEVTQQQCFGSLNFWFGSGSRSQTRSSGLRIWILIFSSVAVKIPKNKFFSMFFLLISYYLLKVKWKIYIES